MNRDFEIRQLLRAYRSGLMSEAAFEEEMARLEGESGGQGAETPRDFLIGGRAFRSERDAVLLFLDELHASQLDSAIGFAKWAAVCRTLGLRTGLLIAAEREAYHARVLERRMHELGGELRCIATGPFKQLSEVLADSGISDLEKLTAFSSAVPEPQQLVAPLLEFSQLLNRDVETKQALRLIASDELSTAAWMHESLAAVQAFPRSPGPQAGNADAAAARPLAEAITSADRART